MTLPLSGTVSQAVLKHVSNVQRFHLQEVYAREQLILYPAKNEEIYGIIVPYQKNFHVMLHYFLKKTSTCGSQVDYMSHIWIVLRVSGSNGSTGVTQWFSTLDR